MLEKPCIRNDEHIRLGPDATPVQFIQHGGEALIAIAYRRQRFDRTGPVIMLGNKSGSLSHSTE